MCSFSEFPQLYLKIKGQSKRCSICWIFIRNMISEAFLMRNRYKLPNCYLLSLINLNRSAPCWKHLLKSICSTACIFHGKLSHTLVCLVAPPHLFLSLSLFCFSSPFTSSMCSLCDWSEEVECWPMRRQLPGSLCLVWRRLGAHTAVPLKSSRM